MKISLEIEKQKNMNIFVNSFGTLLNDSNKKQIFKELMNDSCPVIDEDSEAQEEPIKVEKEELQTSISKPEEQLEDQEITQTDSSEISDNDGIKKRKKKIVSYIFIHTHYLFLYALHYKFNIKLKYIQFI